MENGSTSIVTATEIALAPVLAAISDRHLPVAVS